MLLSVQKAGLDMLTPTATSYFVLGHSERDSGTILGKQLLRVVDILPLLPFPQAWSIV